MLARMAALPLAPGAFAAQPPFPQPAIPLRELGAACGVLFGSALGLGRGADNTAQIDDSASNAILEYECATIVPENEMKIYVIGDDVDAPNFGPGDRIARFARAHGMRLRGHTLLWSRQEYVPRRFRTGGASAGTATALADWLTAYVGDVSSHFKPQVYSWDVVNEAVDPATGALRETAFTRALGFDTLRIAYEAARRHAPGAQLVYNDYMSWGSGPSRHRDGVLRLLERFRREGVPVDALGVQSHIGASGNHDARAWRGFLDTVVSMGYRFLVTEFDVDDRSLPPDTTLRDAGVAAAARDYLGLMLSYRELDQLLCWGMGSSGSWLQGVAPRPGRQPQRCAPGPRPCGKPPRPPWRARRSGSRRSPRECGPAAVPPPGNADFVHQEQPMTPLRHLSRRGMKTTFAMSCILASCGSGNAADAAGGGASAAQATAPTVTVDYDLPLGPSRFVGSGFLHGISAQLPAQYLIDGVHVTAIRGADHDAGLPSLFDPATHARVAQTGARLMVGTYYYSSHGGSLRKDYRPGDNGDVSTYQDIVRSVLDEARAKNIQVQSWITWNEPDLQFNSDSRPFTHFLSGHKAAYDTIKAYDPGYRVQAPEMSGFYPGKLQQFLLFCRDNHCLPDILSWHELSNDLVDVESHVATIRKFMESNGIAPMPVAITEYQGQGYGNPGAYAVGKNVSWLARFERAASAGLRYALYSDWTNSGGGFKATLGNAIDPSSGLPRGVWWNYNAYKAMTGVMLKTVADTRTVDAMAGSDSDLLRSTILVGNQTPDAVPMTLALRNVPRYLSSGDVVHVRAEIVANDPVLTAPAVAYESDVRSDPSRLILALPPLPASASYRIHLRPSTAGKPASSYEAEQAVQTHDASAAYEVFSEDGASGGRAAVLKADSPGASVSYGLNAPSEGIYNVSAVLKRERDREIVQLYIDGQAAGSPQDMFGAAAYDAKEFGNVRLARGAHRFEFVSVAKNPQSSGYRMVFDRFELWKIG